MVFSYVPYYLFGVFGQCGEDAVMVEGLSCERLYNLRVQVAKQNFFPGERQTFTLSKTHSYKHELSPSFDLATDLYTDCIALKLKQVFL